MCGKTRAEYWTMVCSISLQYRMISSLVKYVDEEKLFPPVDMLGDVLLHRTKPICQAFIPEAHPV